MLIRLAEAAGVVEVVENAARRIRA